MARCGFTRAPQHGCRTGLRRLISEIPLSLYIHFPWCVKKCPYCDFNSHPARGEIPEAAYVDALIQDFAQQLKGLNGRKIQTVFMGGGTPSLISSDQIQRLMDVLFASGQLRSDAEITLEANPGAVDEAHFEAYLQAGVNRLSIGVQSFNDKALLKIGRIHSATQAIQAIERTKTAGFDRVNLDLMYGLPGQSIYEAARDIEQALSFGVSHLSVYQLTIEPNTQFALTPPKLPDSDQAWEMHEQAQQLLGQAGLTQYEVSAYSQNSPCQHNLNYWQFGDYLAIGAGAHGKLSERDAQRKLQIKRFWNHRHPKRYLQAVDDGKFSAEANIISKQDIDFEYLMNALRLKTGFAFEQYETRTGRSATALIKTLSPFINRGWLVKEQAFIRPTEKGYRFIDSMLMKYLPAR